MPDLPFFPAVPCPSCGQTHDFYVPRPDRLPYSTRGRYEFICPSTGLAAVLVPKAGHTAVAEPPPGAVPVVRATGLRPGGSGAITRADRPPPAA